MLERPLLPERLRLHGRRRLLPFGPEALRQQQVLQPADDDVLHRPGDRLGLRRVVELLQGGLLPPAVRAVLQERVVRQGHDVLREGVLPVGRLLRLRRALQALPPRDAYRHLDHEQDDHEDAHRYDHRQPR